MPLFTESSAFRIIDAVAIILAEAYQLARARVAACASPVLRLMAQRDHISWKTQLLRRELDGLRGQRDCPVCRSAGQPFSCPFTPPGAPTIRGELHPPFALTLCALAHVWLG